MTKLETFREACTAAQDAPIDTCGRKVDIMLNLYEEFKSEPDVIAQVLTLSDDPNPMVRYMVAVIIRPTMPERADEMFKTVADEHNGIASIWAAS